MDPKLFRYAEEYVPEPTRTYRVRSEDTWREARAEYASGLPAEQVCDRHDLGMSAFRKRARQEGWRRGDFPDPPAEAEPDVLPPAPPLRELIDTAMARLAWCLARGRISEAAGCARLHKYLSGLAAHEAKAAAETADAAAACSAKAPASKDRHLGLVPRAHRRAAPGADGDSGGAAASPVALSLGPPMDPRDELEGDGGEGVGVENQEDAGERPPPAEVTQPTGHATTATGPPSPAMPAEVHTFHRDFAESDGAESPPPPWRDWAHVEETRRRRNAHGISARDLPDRLAPA